MLFTPVRGVVTAEAESGGAGGWLSGEVGVFTRSWGVVVYG